MTGVVRDRWGNRQIAIQHMAGSKLIVLVLVLAGSDMLNARRRAFQAGSTGTCLV
jgi:hypothetical protein